MTGIRKKSVNSVLKQQKQQQRQAAIKTWLTTIEGNDRNKKFCACVNLVSKQQRQAAIKASKSLLFMLTYCTMKQSCILFAKFDCPVPTVSYCVWSMNWFIRWATRILSWKLTSLCEEENQRIQRKILGVRLRPTNLCLWISIRTTNSDWTQLAVVGSEDNNHCASLTPIDSSRQLINC